MDIKILGMGCPKCVKLYENTQKAVADKGIEATITKVEELPSIMKYNVMTTPALVIDEKVVLSGQVASPEKIGELL
ncbi:MAG: thioredoxin family protein [Spirochaetales bacterium]|nr:thioredoxin family protein [Spirochaetales bacterium]